MTVGVVLLHLLCTLLLAWPILSCWKVHRGWWESAAEGLEPRELRRFFARQVASFGEARVPLIPFSDTTVLHLYDSDGWAAYRPSELRELLARERSDEVATTLRVIDTAYQVSGRLDRRAVHRLLARLPREHDLELYLPERGDAADYGSMETVGQGFHVRRVLRPGFRYGSRDVFRRATVEVDA